MERQLHLIGVGGVGGWIINLLDKSPSLVHGVELHIWDKDKVEEKNLSRQFFQRRHVNRPKVNAFADTIKNFKVVPHDDWFTMFTTEVKPDSIIICAADNHGARNSALYVGDRFNCPVIIGANETIEAESYIYLPKWFETERDPRVYYPIINEPDPHDPAAARCGDVEVLDDTPQLAIANMLAASYCMFLFHHYFIEEATDYSIYKINNTSKKIFSTKLEVQL